MNRRLSGLVLGIMAAATARGASAAPERRAAAAPREHPRQEQVVRRDERERRTIRELYDKKVIDKAQYKELEAQLKTVVREDRADSKANGGYITKQQQENMDQLLGAIRSESKSDAGADRLAAWLSDHPRQAEVLRRDWIEQDRVEHMYAEGKLTLTQRDQIVAELRKVAREDRSDAKADGGAITSAEQAAMNKQENKIDGQAGKDVAVDHAALVKWLADHPRQAEVLRRDWREQDRVNGLFADGKITAAQRDLIIAQLRAVAHEDRADARADGGAITPAEKAEMNKQENALNREIMKDAKVDAAWMKAHPLQAEVLRRDRREQDRVRALMASGQITEAQGQALLAELKDVAREDRADAEANGGFITRGQQGTMNGQENEVNAAIKTDKSGN
jgi:hypothetical protein